MNIDRIKQHLTTQWLGRKIHYLPQTDSTNRWALSTCEDSNSPSNTHSGTQGPIFSTEPSEALTHRRGEVFVTDHQTAGRGRMNRVWEAQSQKNLLLSFIDSPPDRASPHHLTLVSAVAFVKALLFHAPNLPIELKWPNDIMCKGKKIGGILTALSPNKKHVVIGVGINVNSSANDFSPEISSLATSLSMLSGHPFERESILASCLNEYETLREIYDKKGFAPLIDLWKHHSSMLGRPVLLQEDSHTTEGVAMDLNADGFLLVQTKQGIQTILSGDVSVLWK